MAGFVALVPWLRTLDAQPSWRRALLSAWGMAVAYTAAAFSWFGVAIGNYTGVGATAGVAMLLLGAPLLQPQILVYALVRHGARPHGAGLRAVVAACAWVATEWLVPRWLGDTFGHGLYPSLWMRQAADVGGTAGLTFLLLLANEAIAHALARRREGVRALAIPLAGAVLVPLVLAAYGAYALSALPREAAPPLRVGLVQSNIVDYERLRREKGAGAVVREVLDTHFAMSYDAVERRGAHAVLWSETVYPTTFLNPKSEAGAELDREILAIVSAAKVPFVFGTYDRDAVGEYNAAAFVAPDAGLVGFYRKARPFPLTEHVPGWIDSPAVRGWLPWLGSWRPGDGARVFPLRLADGREIPVLPLICLDDVDTTLGVAGARMGAQVILTLSNDAWFDARGARLHEAAAAFRSVETRLPQFRVTTDGYSAVIDAAGTVLAGTRKGERTLVVGDLPVRDPPTTLVVAWGDWVGRAAAAFLLLMAAAALLRRWSAQRAAPAGTQDLALPARVFVLPAPARWLVVGLRTLSRGTLLWMAGVAVFGDGSWQASPLAQVRSFAALVLAPEAAAWCVLHAFAARLAIEEGRLVLARGRARLELALRDIAGVQPWRVPAPVPGTTLRLASGESWPHGLAHMDPLALARALDRPLSGGDASRAASYAHVRLQAARGRLAHPLARFVLLPLVLAIPAFRLHQIITFGGAFGQYQVSGLLPYLKSFALWWATWAIAVVLVAAVVRAVIEAFTIGVLALRPARVPVVRAWLEAAGLAVLYLGMPGWLLLRLTAS